MRMTIETLGGLTTRIVGAAGDGPAVVLLHGFGAPGTDLVPIAGALDAPEGTQFFFPEAPLALPWGGDARAWWMVDLEKLQRALSRGTSREMSDEVPPGLVPAREALLALLADLDVRLGIPPERVVLGGFSQGSMLALDVALRHERSVGGLILWSTTMLMTGEWEPLMPARSGMRALMSHGMQDPLLPFRVAEVLHSKLEEAGWFVDWHPFRGGHEIPEVALRGASRLLDFY